MFLIYPLGLFHDDPGPLHGDAPPLAAVRHYEGTTADTPLWGKSDFRGEMAGKYRAIALPNRLQLLGTYTRI